MMVINSIYALQKDSRGISEMGFPVSILPAAVSSFPRHESRKERVFHRFHHLSETVRILFIHFRECT